MRLKDKAILVTGSTTGIGEGIARRFVAEGAKVILHGRNAERGNALRQELGPENAAFCQGDLGDAEYPDQLAEDALAAFGRIDVLVNNAGYGILGNFHQISWNQHRDFIEVLSTSVIYLTYLFLPKMIDNKFGRIINIASLVGLIPGGGTMYSAAKTMVVKFSQGIHISHTRG